MNIWSDVMANLIENIKSDRILYYVGLLLVIALLCFIVYLICQNDKKKKQKIKEINEEKARIERHVDLEAMLAQMQEQEQNKMKDVDPVANFEQEQEEKAIISYQELVNAVRTEQKEPICVTNVSSTGDVISTTKLPRTEISEDKPIFIDEIKLPKGELTIDSIDEEETPISLSDTHNLLSTAEDKPILFHATNPIIEEVNNEISEVKTVTPVEKTIEKPGKFKNTEFISPIYGRQNSNITYPKIASFDTDNQDEQVINISDNVDLNLEFLKTLREYRNNNE